MKTLLATDGSADAHAAIHFLKRIGLPNRSDVILLAVVQPIRAFAYSKRERLAVKDIAGTIRTEAQEMLDKEAQLLQDQNWEIETDVREGHISEEIIATAEETKSDLIVVGARGLSPVRRFLLGSVSQKVVKYAPCSVLIVRETQEQVEEPNAARIAPVRVLLAFDESESSQRAVDRLASLPLGDETDVTLLMVLPTITEHQEQLSERWQTEKQNAQEALERIEARLRKVTPNVRTMLRASTDVSEAIVETAEQLDIHLIVLGHKGKGAVKRFLLGSVSNRVVHHAHCHVYIVR